MGAWGAGLISGALEGAGRAGVNAIHTAQEQYGKEQLQASEQQFQTALENLRQGGADRRLATTEAGSDRRQGVAEAGQDRRQAAGQTFTAGENQKNRDNAFDLQQAGFGHAEEMQAAQQDFQAEQNRLQRNLTASQIASQQKIAQANNETALAIAKTGGTAQQDKDGNFFFLGKDGTTKPIMDPNDPTKQLKGLKDLTPAAKAYADSIKAQLVDLDRLEANAAGDQTQLAQIAARRAALTAEQLNVLTGGISAAGKSGSPYPDGTELKGKDGKTYVVTNGAPVLKGQAGAPAAPAAPKGGTFGSHDSPQPAPPGGSAEDARIRAEIQDKKARLGYEGISDDTKLRLSTEILALQRQLGGKGIIGGSAMPWK